jgi:hypothetical protein
MVRASRRAEKVPLIPTTTKVDSAGVVSRRDALRRTPPKGQGPSQKKVISLPDVTGAVLVVFLTVVGVAVALTAHSRRDPAVEWEAATAYPYTPLSVARYTTADVLRTAREGRWFRLDPRREATFARDPTAWLADPTDLTVFSWEDGVFSMNVLRPAPGELGAAAAPPEVSDDILAMWREHRYADLAAVGGAGHAKVYDAFVALVYTAQAYAPGRFKKGQPPFHVVTHQREYLSPECLRDVPRGSKFNPCPAAKRWAPVLNFGANPKTAAVFPTSVKMPDVDFVATVLRNEANPSEANAHGPDANANAIATDADASPLGLDESALDRFVHAGERLKPWEERVSVVAWRGADVAFAPSMPFGADRMDSALCREMLVDVLELAPEEADRALSRPRGDDDDASSAADADAPRRRATVAGLAAWMESRRGVAASRAMTPRWRAVMLSAVARGKAAAAKAGGAGISGETGSGSGSGSGETTASASASFGADPASASASAIDVARHLSDADVAAFASEDVAALSSSKVLGGEWLDARFTDVDAGPCGDALPLALRGDALTHVQRQHYKYALDTGGVGGGSGLATLEAMAAASLVFRVESPLADFYAAELQPWTHYVPVAADLSDLQEKYLWAQSHQTEAREMAARGAVFARDMSAEKTWAAYASLPLGAARRAYSPTPSDGNKHGHPGDAPPAEGSYESLVAQLVPVYEYDVARHGHESGHTGVMLPDPARAAGEGRAAARKRAREREKEEEEAEEEAEEEVEGQGQGQSGVAEAGRVEDEETAKRAAREEETTVDAGATESPKP